MKKFIALSVLAMAAATAFAADSTEPVLSRMPPMGITVPADIKTELEAGVDELGRNIEGLKKSFATTPEQLEMLPDVQIYYNAVRYALADGMFFKTNEFEIARKLLQEGTERANDLRAGKTPWNTATGLIVRGYVSKIDGSVIPYGLVVPVTYQTTTTNQYRLDFWFHGRGEQLSELSFINDREKNAGEFTPPRTFVLHPYGRFCNAFKFAGEVDVFEALEHARRHYPVDTNHISVRGFSMGGAATWHFGVHYAGLWAAVAPGAGFAETALFSKSFSKTPTPSWYEQKLWHFYDATDCAGNLFNTRVVAYSGEIDGQKQAADVMTKAMAAEGLTLTHIIGPNTAHKYEPKAKEEVARLVDAIADEGRNPMPKQVKFTTWNLRFNEMNWMTVDGMGEHWSRAQVNVEIVGDNKIVAQTTNVTALTFAMPAGLCPLATAKKPVIVLDGQEVSGPRVVDDQSWTAHFRKSGTKWESVKSAEKKGLAKRHGLQGPIDDAFMDSFIMVRPTGQPLNFAVGAWADEGLKHAEEQWHLQFRGEARVKDDTDITAADIAENNLILFGDPKSNKVLAKLAPKLPMKWDASGVRIGAENFSPDTHVPVLIYPNPLNPKRYIVLNTGFTFSEIGRPSNALQVPMLPDYAVMDITVPLAKQIPSGAVAAGFFDEEWKLSRADITKR